MLLQDLMVAFEDDKDYHNDSCLSIVIPVGDILNRSIQSTAEEMLQSSQVGRHALIVSYSKGG